MKKYIFLLLLLPLFLYSCQDFLDQKSRAQIDADEMFDSDQGFKDALMACYKKMNSNTLYGQNLTMTRIELMAQHWNPDGLNNTQLITFKNLDYTSDDSRSLFEGIFSGLYNVIVQANDVLGNLPEKGNYITYASTRGVIEAEALTIRAFCHFDVLRLFGQMPNTPGKNVDLPYAKTVGKEAVPYYGYSDFVNLIIEDLDAAEKLFKEHDPLKDYSLLDMDSGVNLVNDVFLAYRRLRFNLYTVKALKARLYLYIGKPEQANRYAREVINAVSASNDPMVSLAGNSDLDAGYYALPTECITALSNTSISTSLFSISNYRLTTTRFEQLFADVSSSANNRKMKLWKSDESDPVNTIYPYPLKYKATGTNYTRVYIVPLFRLSEMYLIAMETGTLTEGNALYTTYMAARNEIGVSSLTESELATKIENEYRREFYGEGYMFYYYKRKGSTSMLWQSNDLPELTDKHYVVPIPEVELKGK